MISKSIQKLIAWVLVLTFLAPELSYAATSEGAAVAALKINPPGQLGSDLWRFQTPPEFSLLKEIHRGGSDTFIIHIQDAHSNLSGQKNLASTLDFLMQKYGVRLILVEGSSKEATLDPIKRIAPSKTILERAAKSFLIQGQIAGEEYLNLSSDRPMRIMGIEDRSLYIKSLENYGRLADKREKILAYLQTIQASLDKLKTKLYAKELLGYEKKCRDFSGEEGLDRDLKTLLTLCEAKNIDFQNLPGATKLLALQKREESIDFSAANLEQASLIQELEGKGKGEKVKKIVGAGLSSAQSKPNNLSKCALFQNLFSMAQENNIALFDYPNLRAYAEYLKEFSGIDLDEALEDLKRLEERLYRALLRKKDARLVRAIDRYIRLLNLAYRIRMTTRDFGLFRANEKDFTTISYLAFINRRLIKLGYFGDLVPYENHLEEGKRALENFYDSVNQRDLAFARNPEL